MMHTRIQKLTAHAVLVLLLAAGMVMVYLTGIFAMTVNGYHGFPLDDPWIHLQFAKNVYEYGSFSYYQDELVTSGSTSPLYTLLLACGFIFTEDEMMLSYVLGAVFFAVGGFFFFRLVRHQFGNQLLVATFGTLLFLFEPRLQWVTLSGMETTLFITVVLASVYYYYRKDPLAFGIACGLLLWSRPEGLLVLFMLAGDYLYHRFLVKGTSSEPAQPPSLPQGLWPVRSIAVAAVLLIAYAAFNLILSGTVLPNTYAAKLKYYSAGGEEFPVQVLHFLSDGHMILPALFALLGLGSVLLKAVRRQVNPFLIPVMWVGGMVIVYWWKLPYLYHNGRYLMPVLPMVLILAFHGISVFSHILRTVARALPDQTLTRTLQTGVLGIAALQFVFGSWSGRATYAEHCRYINERHVTSGRWIRDHLPPDAIVATHDIGAVAFYSDRRIVDMVGLVSPEIIDRIGKTDALLEHLTQNNVTHLAILRWFTIDNINPLFQTDEMRPEVMEIFEYRPDQMHFVEAAVSRMTEAASLELMAGNIHQAGYALEQAVRKDPRSARAHRLLGEAYLAIGEYDRAERAFSNALELQKDSWKALQGLAEVEVGRERPRQAVQVLETLIGLNPEYRPAYGVLAQIYYRNKFDWSKGEQYLRTYRQLASLTQPPGD